MFVGSECIFIIFLPFDLSFTLNKWEGYHSYIFCYFGRISKNLTADGYLRRLSLLIYAAGDC